MFYGTCVPDKEMLDNSKGVEYPLALVFYFLFWGIFWLYAIPLAFLVIFAIYFFFTHGYAVETTLFMLIFIAGVIRGLFKKPSLSVDE